ncbi:unnamed protein product [Notodromas monacha]|uniref:ubiquitinyl hydrolase 1 n=1 Tax=Notodromas monacha TaxID=399045 RepID=A0A7R9BT13_9CRUS|nr:unnamed protein product [Notodromas monacha]CAG0919775.1 unnamed protein product [Notodromas monacha]
MEIEEPFPENSRRVRAENSSYRVREVYDVPVNCNLRYVEEKPVGIPLTLLEWSPKMDLIAVASKTGEALLYRLNWVKIWGRAPPDISALVTAIVWRPDGRLIAFGYKSGDIMLREIEHGDTVHYLHVSSEVTFLHWSSETFVQEDFDSRARQKHTVFPPSFDNSEDIFPELPSLSKCFGMAKGVWEERDGTRKRMLDSESLNILVVCLSSSRVLLYAYGIFLFAAVSLEDLELSKNPTVLGAAITDNFDKLLVVLREADSFNTHLRTFKTSFVRREREDVIFFAKICAQMGTLIQYLNRCMQGIREAVELMSGEFESKFDSIRQSLDLDCETDEDSRYDLLAQFAEYKAFGCLSDALEKDFVHGISVRGLRKLRTSLERGYTNIQSLLTEYMLTAAEALYDHADRLLGLARCEETYDYLGFSKENALKTVKSVEQLVLKINEFQQVLLKLFESFLKFKPCDSLPDGNETTPEETQCAMDFVEQLLAPHFRHPASSHRQGKLKMLEQVTQYIKDTPLVFPVDNRDEEGLMSWAEFVDSMKEEYGAEVEDDLTVTDARVSLTTALRICAENLQELVEFRQSFGDIPTFGEPAELKFGFSPCVRFHDGCILFKSITKSQQEVAFCSLKNGQWVGVRCQLMAAGESSCPAVIDDADFYSPAVTSFLIYDQAPAKLLQLPWKDIVSEFSPIEFDSFPCVLFRFRESVVQNLDDIRAGGSLAISGTRKVVAILFKDKLRVRVMETEYVEDDEEQMTEDARDESSGNMVHLNSEDFVILDEDEQFGLNFERFFLERDIFLYGEDMMEGHIEDPSNSEAEAVQVPDSSLDQETLILEQQRKIDAEIADQHPLVGPLVGFDDVRSEYPPDSPFVTKLNQLEDRYKGMRSIRRDGNCFLRSFAFGYFEYCLTHQEEFEKFKKFALNSKTDLVAQGLPGFAVDDTYDNVAGVFESMDAKISLDDLSKRFNDQATSDYLVSYLRMVISGHLQKEATFYEPFLIDQSIKEFCQREVEPMFKDCDHIHVTALANATDVPIRVEYLDREQDSVSTHDFLPMDIHGTGSEPAKRNPVASSALCELLNMRSVLCVLVLFCLCIHGNEETLFSNIVEPDINVDDIPVVEGHGSITIPIDQHDVLILDKSIFLHIINTNRIILVEFYAPWCGHCKSLEPEYAKAAELLKDDGIKLAKVDATQEEELSKSYGVTGFPTLMLFLNGVKVEEYQGPRNAHSIAEYMREKADPNWKPPPSNVVSLTSSNFSSFVKKEKLALIEFYDPACTHCKKLVPELEQAAKELRNDGIAIAKIDGILEKALSDEYGVRGWPTLFVLRSGRVFEYRGTRDAKGIIKYMREMKTIPSVEVKSAKQLKNSLPRLTAAVVGVFDQDGASLRNEFISASYIAKGEDLEFKFFHTSDPEVARFIRGSINSIVIIKPDLLTTEHETQHYVIDSKSASANDIMSSIKAHATPLVGIRTKQNSAQEFQKRPILVAYYDVNYSVEFVSDTERVRRMISAVAKDYPDIQFAISSESTFAEELKLLGLDDSGEDVNVAIWGSNGAKYPMEPADNLGKEDLHKFVKNFLAGEVKSFIRSQAAPKKNDGAVEILVGSTFQKAMSSNRDYLIEFYAPWCGH